MVRRAGPEEAPALAAVQAASVRGLAPRRYEAREVAAWLEASDAPERLREKLARDLFLVAEDAAGRPVGFASLAGDELDLLYVHPDHAGRGVGARLVAAVEEEARARGVRTLRARASLCALGLLLRSGFARVRDAPQTVGGVRVPAVDVEKRLA